MLLYTFSRFERTIPKIKKVNYIPNPDRLGQKVKNRRLALGLTQTQAGQMLKVERTGLSDWENLRTEPAIEFYPAIIEFLGYDPFFFDLSKMGERLKRYRFLHGLSQEKLARKIGTTGATIYRLEQGIGIPGRKTMAILKQIPGLFESDTSALPL
jgi:transcriptional regulator with XRE-family HTH domain